MTEEDTEDRNNWRRKIRCGDPLMGKAERRRRTNMVYSMQTQNDYNSSCIIVFLTPQSETVLLFTRRSLVANDENVDAQLPMKWSAMARTARSTWGLDLSSITTATLKNKINFFFIARY